MFFFNLTLPFSFILQEMGHKYVFLLSRRPFSDILERGISGDFSLGKPQTP